MCVHLDKGKAAVGLEARLDNKAKVLEQRNHIVGSRVRSEVTNIAGGLPAGGLGEDNVVASNAMRRELVVAERCGRCQAHSLHRLLLSHRRLAFLVGPVAANGARAKPFTIHGAKCFFSLASVTEGNEAVASRSPCLHIPHDAALGDGAKSREGLLEHLIVDFVGQVTHKDVKVGSGVFLVGCVGLVCPVDSDFLRLVSTMP